MLKNLSATVPTSLSGQRFDLVAVQLFPELSRKKIKLIIDSGGAYVNKKRIQIAKYALKTNDTIELFWNGETPQKIENKNIKGILTEKNILFENDDFFVINKPAGIASQATLTSSTDTIIHMLCSMNAEKFKLDKMFLVHRLDKDTSGIMIIARNKNAQKIFEDLFRAKKVLKTYDALCFHSPKQNSGMLTFPIAKDKSRQNTYYAITNLQSKKNDTKEAQTQYNVIKIFKQDASHIECQPKTGRTHQIRVHLAAMGCPLLGDKTYSQNIVGHQFLQIALRHMLHASKVEFEFKNKKFEFNCPFPDDFKDVLAKLTSS